MYTSRLLYSLSDSYPQTLSRIISLDNVAILNPTDSTLLGGGVSNESGYFAVNVEDYTEAMRQVEMHEAGFEL